MVDLVMYPVYLFFDVWVVEDRKQLVVEVRVDSPVLVVQPSFFHVFVEDSLLLNGRSPCCDVCRSIRVGQEEKGGSG